MRLDNAKQQKQKPEVPIIAQKYKTDEPDRKWFLAKTFPNMQYFYLSKLEEKVLCVSDISKII